MGGKKTVTNNIDQTQKNAPPEWALPGLQELAQRITSIIPQVPGQQYGGEFIAGPNALQQGSLPLYAGASQQALGASQQAGEAAQALTGQGAQFGEWLTPRFDTSQAAAAATAPIMRNLTENILPGLQSSALQSGAYGNTRMTDILPSLAIRDATRGAQEIAAQMAFTEHQGAMQNQLQGFGAMTERGLGTEGLRQQRLMGLPQLLDTQMRMGAGAGDILSMAGNLQQGWDQSAIDNELAKFQYNLQYPFQGLDTAASLLAGLAHGYGTQTMTGTNKTVEKSGGMAPWLGAALGIGSTIAGFPGIGSMFGGGGK